MITTELYISNIKVDTNEDVVFALNYWMADIRNPESRNTDFSKTITIPGTQENNKLFTHIYQIGVDSTFNPNNKADVILFNGGARTFRGYAQLKNIVRQFEGFISYEINLFGEVGNIFQDMGEKYIDALDFSELAHVKNTATIQSSWSNTSGYVYPIINNGQIDVVTQNYMTINAKDMVPALYAKTIWDKIHDTYGFRYNSTFISGAPFNRLIVPAEGIPPTRSMNVTGTFNFLITTTGGIHTITLRVRRVNNGGIIDNIYTLANTFPAPALLAVIDQTLPVYPLDQIFITVTFQSTDLGATCSAEDTSNWGVNYPDDIINGYAPGDFLAGKLVAQNIPINIESNLTFPDEIYDPDNSYNPVTSRHTVPDLSIAAQIPKLKQRDFMIGVIRMFNLYIAPDPLDEKILLVLPRDQYYASGTVVNWSQKVDMSRQWQQQPMPFLNFKTHLWKYKQDEDFYNKLYRETWGVNYGDKELNVLTDFQTETSTIEIVFSATPSVRSSLTPFVLPTIIKENPIDFPSGNVYVGNPRILYYGGMKDGEQWTLTDGIVSITPTQYPFASHIDDPADPQLDILFDTPKQVYFYIDPGEYTANNLYNVYYSKFIEEITDKDSKLVTVYAYLTPFDIQIFDFKNNYYLLQNGFHVNKIIDFNPNTPEVTKVELVKMKEGRVWVPSKVKHIPPGTAINIVYLWVSPMDMTYKLINGLHWFYGGSVDSVFDVTGTTFPMSIQSPKNAVY